jgi:uncharacterized protein YihD (DUF1040 family)
MRNPERIDKILEELRTYWKERPDLRLGQIVSNMRASSDKKCSDVFYFEDEDFLEELLCQKKMNTKE